MIARTFRHAALLAPGLALGLSLAGCVSFAGKPPKQLVSLTSTASAPAGALTGGALADALIVADPVADRRLDQIRVAVQVNEATVAYLKDATWAERPARQLRRLIAETIRARGKRMVLEGYDASGAAKTTLSGRLLDMGYDARSRSVVVRYDAVRSDKGGAVQARRFEKVISGVAPEAEAIAPALNRAANDVAVQVADWVG